MPSRAACQIESVTSGGLIDRVRRHGHRSVYFIAGVDLIAPTLADVVQPRDLVITLGAGDITRGSDLLITELRRREEE